MECRTCLKVTDDLQDLFTDDCDLPHKIETISSIQILVNDQFPSKICHACVTNVELLYEFRGIVRKSNMILENRAYSAQNEEIGESDNHTEAIEPEETKLIQIDEIKIENSDFNDSIKNNDDDEVTKTEVSSSRSIIRKTTRGVKTKFGRIYNCSQCDFTTQQYNFLRTHRKRHKDKQELRSICNICGKSITTDNLSKHLSNHTETPVTCKICGKVVKHKESLRGHMYMHKGISLQCTYCGKIFHNRQSYYKHIQRHKNEYESPNESSDSDSDMSTDEMADNNGNETRGSSSQTSDRSKECLTKKRRKDVSKWARTIRKEKRMKGEEYIGHRNIQRPARPMLPCPCSGKQKHKCTDIVEEHRRLAVYTEFRGLTSIDAQRQFILNNVERTYKKRTTRNIENSRKTYTNHYSFTVNGKKQIVCREFFLATLNVRDAFIRTCLKNQTSSGMLKANQRGNT